MQGTKQKANNAVIMTWSPPSFLNLPRRKLNLNLIEPLAPTTSLQDIQETEEHKRNLSK